METYLGFDSTCLICNKLLYKCNALEGRHRKLLRNMYTKTCEHIYSEMSGIKSKKLKSVLA